MTGDTVKVVVRRANLMHFGYLVTLDVPRPLVHTFGLVGFGRVADQELTDTAVDVPLQARVKAMVDAIPKATYRPDTTLLEALIDRLDTLAKDIRELTGSIATAIRPIARQDEDVAAVDCRGFWSTSYARLDSEFNSVQNSLAISIRNRREQAASLKAFTQRVRLSAEAANTAIPDDKNKIKLGGFLAVYDTAVTAIERQLSDNESALNGARRAVARWKTVMSTYPEPMLTVEFIVNRADFRYTVKVQRYATTLTGLRYQGVRAAVGADSSKPDTMQLATVTYDSHGYSRFNLSLGLTSAFRFQDRRFAIVPTLTNSGLARFAVAESTVTRAAFRPAAFLSIYLHQVDDLDDARPWASPMVSIGAELAGGNRAYFVGGAVDFRAGFQLGLGVSTYQGVNLAEGWGVGQLIPVDSAGALVVKSPPVRERTRIAPYLFVGFRPVLFEKLFAKITHIGGT